MARTFNFYGNNQYNEKTENATQINMVENSFDSRIIEISNQIKDILEKIRQGYYDSIIDTSSTELDNMLINLEYELSYAKNLVNIKEFSQIKEKFDEMQISIDELKRGKKQERKIKLLNILTRFSEVCTVITVTPQLIDIAQNIMVHIKTFLNI